MAYYIFRSICQGVPDVRRETNQKEENFCEEEHFKPSV